MPGSVVDSVRALSNPKHIGSALNTASKMPWKIHCLRVRVELALPMASRLQAGRKQSDPQVLRIHICCLASSVVTWMKCCWNVELWTSGCGIMEWQPSWEGFSTIWEWEIAPLLCWALVAALRIKLTEDRLTRETETHFNSRAQRSHGNGTLEVGPKQAVFTCCWQIDFWGIDGTKRLRFGEPN